MIGDNDIWTLESLKKHYDAILLEREKRIDERFKSIDQAVSKAEQATERRFESVNEFRQQLGDQSRSFMPRQENENNNKSINDRIDLVTKKVDKLDNMKQGGNVVWVYIVASISIITGIVSVFISIFNSKL